jgi:3'-phosphoadenosine 5'-phosphosulfate sulfotransferase (PAPS reductase)/FAD synthetase
MKEIFSSGGGTQSAAIAALIVQGRLPRPDVVVIADTGYERATTWQYLDAVIRPELAKIGLEVHRVTQEWATAGLISTSGKTVLMPLFTSQTDETAKLPGYCSNEWKVRPVSRYLRNALGIESKDQKRWLGFSLDESRRALRMMGGDEYTAGKIRFPLIHDVPLRREQAIHVVQQMGWPTPPRSACYMCPNMSDDEWRGISPEELAKAAQLERQLQEHDPHVWLHKSCQPIATVDFNKPDEQGKLFERACSSGVCFV